MVETYTEWRYRAEEAEERARQLEEENKTLKDKRRRLHEKVKELENTIIFNDSMASNLSRKYDRLHAAIPPCSDCNGKVIFTKERFLCVVCGITKITMTKENE